MRHSKHSAPEVNAGSMADIAFLLLIFFLVTTTISSDVGINRELPKPCPPGQNCTTTLKERNVLRISLNGSNELFVHDDIVTLAELKPIVKAFLDNNGDGTCKYCNGLQLVDASENPSEAVISLANDADTSYEMYVKVQDELSKAYYELRASYAKTVLGKSENNLTESDLKALKKAYPFKISEVESR